MQSASGIKRNDQTLSLTPKGGVPTVAKAVVTAVLIAGAILLALGPLLHSYAGIDLLTRNVLLISGGVALGASLIAASFLLCYFKEAPVAHGKGSSARHAAPASVKGQVTPANHQVNSANNQVNPHNHQVNPANQANPANPANPQAADRVIFNVGSENFNPKNFAIHAIGAFLFAYLPDYASKDLLKRITTYLNNPQITSFQEETDISKLDHIVKSAVNDPRTGQLLASDPTRRLMLTPPFDRSDASAFQAPLISFMQSPIRSGVLVTSKDPLYPLSGRAIALRKMADRTIELFGMDVAAEDFNKLKMSPDQPSGYNSFIVKCKDIHEVMKVINGLYRWDYVSAPMDVSEGLRQATLYGCS